MRRRAALGLCLLALAMPARAAETCAEAAGQVELFRVRSAELDRWKWIWAWLPPGYGCTAARRYPVFYLHDGHDLFDWSPAAPGLDPATATEIAAREAWYGSWQLDRQLDAAVAAGRLPPLIVVGVASDDGWRSSDLTPVPWSGSPEAWGERHAAFLALTLVPVVDGRYRTQAAPACRGVGGSSLGGVGALQTGLGYPERFGMVLALSPLVREPALAGWLAQRWRAAAGREPVRVLLDFDDDPGCTADMRRLAAAGPGPQGAILIQTPGGRHTIASWAERAVPALAMLLRAMPAACLRP